jgi:hypothetical protein
MIQKLLNSTGVLILCGLAAAQAEASGRLRPITSPIKDAGTYHLATGTWTRGKAPTANLGPDTIYNNTCLLNVFYALSSLETMVDSGRLPSTNSGSVPGSVPGTSDVYSINGFTIAYCGFNAQVDMDVAHYECYSPCTDATQLTPESVISLVGLPGGGGSASALGCWIVNIDLEGSTFEFDLEGDCDRLWDQTPLTDNFGWALTETNPNGNPGGPFLAGDPFGILDPLGFGCAYGDGTVFVGQDMTTPGTGIGTEDVFETDIGGAYGGCWFFGGYLSGNPYASFYHGLYSGFAWDDFCSPGYFCVGDDTGATACPCGNISGNGGGCANGTGQGIFLSCNGATSSVSSDDLVFSGYSQIPNQPGLYFQGNNAINSGAGVGFGDGLRCVGGSLVRLEVVFSDGAGFSSTSAGIGSTGGVSAGDVKRYQLWARDPNTSPCGGNFNLSNGVEINWTP